MATQTSLAPIEERFRKFADDCISFDASPEELSRARDYYFAGAAGMLQIIHTAFKASEGREAEVNASLTALIHAFEAIKRELDQFMADRA